MGFPSKTAHRAVFSPFPAFWDRERVPLSAESGQQGSALLDFLPPFIQVDENFTSRGSFYDFAAIPTRTDLCNFFLPAGFIDTLKRALLGSLFLLKINHKLFFQKNSVQTPFLEKSFRILYTSRQTKHLKHRAFGTPIPTIFILY